MNRLTFEELSVIALDFVDHQDGFLYLRIVGPETVVNACWARLMSRATRGNKFSSGIEIEMPGRSYPMYVAAQKHVNYRTVRSRLSSGMIDLALIHPILTVSEDRPSGFYILTYDDARPAGFFDRLNQNLAIPLKPEWSTWLWREGLKRWDQKIIKTRTEYEGNKKVEKERIADSACTPILRLDTLGSVGCYKVICEGEYYNAWLGIVREQLGLNIKLSYSDRAYTDGTHFVRKYNDNWVFEDFVQSNLDDILVMARHKLGLNLIVKEVEPCHD